MTKDMQKRPFVMNLTRRKRESNPDDIRLTLLKQRDTLFLRMGIIIA